MNILNYDFFAPHVVAFSTERGEVADASSPYDGFNINPYCGDSEEHVDLCRRELASRLGIGPGSIVMPHQTHGTFVADADKGEPLEGVDAVMTARRGVCVGVSTADCMPVLLHDVRHDAVCAVHSGWRGTVRHIAACALEAMAGTYGTRPHDVVAAIGPGIRAEAFEVGDEVYEAFRAEGLGSAASRMGGKWHIDLASAIRADLAAVARVHDCGLCTHSLHRRFFSARRLGIASGRIFSGIMLRAVALLLALLPLAGVRGEVFPNGEEIPAWFADTSRVDISALGPCFCITDYGVSTDSTIVQTAAIQAVIDRAAASGGGVITVPRGTFLSGSLFFRQGTHLRLEEGGKLKGADRIEHFPIRRTRMEGRTIDYFCALVNADSLSSFTITGPGTIDGNGHHYWSEFWIRRQYNPDCTNLEALRPRLVYISRCEDVTVQDVRLVNSPFWTNHLYKCSRVKYLGCHIYAPTSGYGREGRNGAPSSDAIDLDVCHDVLVSGCYMHVNDDAVVIKGGKGTFADLDPDNGPTYNVIVQDCRYGRVHGCLTLGSESLHDWNIILRRIRVDHANRVLWLKMRPDTPQHYEHILVEGVRGTCGSVLYVKPWTQFYQREEREGMPVSRADHITLRDINVQCDVFRNVAPSPDYVLEDVTIQP